jgi:hypothetical protein
VKLNLDLKRTLTSLTLIAIVASITVVAATAIYLTFFPQATYEIGESPLNVAYETAPLDLGYLVKNTEYTFSEYDVSAPAIQVLQPGSITINFSSIDTAHFTEFTVEVWNLTAQVPEVVGSFDLTSVPLTFESGIADYGYFFSFTTGDVTAAGTVTFEVSFQSGA